MHHCTTQSNRPNFGKHRWTMYELQGVLMVEDGCEIEVFRAVTMNSVFWDVTSCGSYKNTVFLRSVRRLLVTANVVPSLPILVTLMMEALSSSETSALTRATWRNIPEDDIPHSHRRENVKSYIALTGWTL
jgi:hypothetical protein